MDTADSIGAMKEELVNCKKAIENYEDLARRFFHLIDQPFYKNYNHRGSEFYVFQTYIQSLEYDLKEKQEREKLEKIVKDVLRKEKLIPEPEKQQEPA